MDDFDVEKAEERPELTLDKVSSAQVYKTILKEAKEIKDGNVVSKESSKETLSEESTENGSDCVKTGDQNFTNSKLSDDLKEVIFGTPDVIVEEEEDKAKKELKPKIPRNYNVLGSIPKAVRISRCDLVTSEIISLYFPV